MHDPGFERQPFERARAAVVAHDDRRGTQEVGQRRDQRLLEPFDPGGVFLHDQHVAEAVDDEPRQPVRLGMDEAVIGRVVQPLAQPQCPLEPPHQEPPPDRPRPVAVEEPRGEKRVRVEHRDAERPLVGAPQGHQRAGRQRLRRGVHRDFVGIDPRVAAFGAAVAAGLQRHGRPRRRVVGAGNRVVVFVFDSQSRKASRQGRGRD